MAHKTIGIEIGAQQIHLVVCTVDGYGATIEQQLSARYDQTDDENTCSQVLKELANQIYAASGTPIEAIGMSLDSTRTLSTHEILPFSDPKIIENTIYNTMADQWTLTEDSIIAFEVGSYVNPKSEEETGGYDVFVLHASSKDIQDNIQILAPCRLDPHVILPELQAFGFILKDFVRHVKTPSVILDMGAEKTRLYIIDENRNVILSRVFKLGGKQLDQSIAETFQLSLEEAEELKCSSGFVALPGKELQQYQHLVHSGVLVPTESDPRLLCQACLSGLNMLYTGIYQSLVLATASMKLDISNIYLTGNASHLAGLEEWLTAQFNVPCTTNIPVINHENVKSADFSFCAIGAAIAASRNIDAACPLNLRKGKLAHKGSLEYLNETKWLLLALVMLLAITGILSMTTRINAVNAEYNQLKHAVEKASQDVFGHKMTSLKQIQKEVESSQGYSFIPARTAFTHFEWLSNKIHEATDMEMELSQLDIDVQRKIVTLRGEVAGDEGLPKFLLLLEEYECFPDEIPEPKTSKNKERTAFTLRVEATNCSSGGADE